MEKIDEILASAGTIKTPRKNEEEEKKTCVLDAKSKCSIADKKEKHECIEALVKACEERNDMKEQRRIAHLKQAVMEFGHPKGPELNHND